MIIDIKIIFLIAIPPPYFRSVFDDPELFEELLSFEPELDEEPELLVVVLLRGVSERVAGLLTCVPLDRAGVLLLDDRCAGL